MAKYSVVVPAFNEQEVIKTAYNRLKQVMDPLGDYELIFVNDGSRDNTLSLLKEIAKADRNVKILSFGRNFGHQEAVSAGMKYASGDGVIIIDADLQDPPEAIPEMIDMWKAGADIVYGQREKRKGESAFKKVTAWGFYRVLNMLGAQRIPRDTGDFRLIDQRVVQTLNDMPEKNRFLRGMSAWAGFRAQPYKYVREARAAGKTKYSLKKMVKLAGDGITSFSNKPLRLPIYFGTGLGVLSLAYLITAVVLSAAGTMDVMHVLFALVFGFIAVLSLFIGVLGVYLGRIYDEAKGRPIYIIDEKINFDGEEK